MPTEQPTVSAVLEMAYTQAKRLASSPDASTQVSPEMRRAIELTWGAIRGLLPADNAKIRELDRLIAKVAKAEGVGTAQGDATAGGPP